METVEEKPLVNNLRTHWDHIYENVLIEKLGWYEEDPEPSLNLIEKCQLNQDAVILNVGAGASTLIDKLLQSGYRNLVATDLSRVALDKLKKRVGIASENVRWIVDDLTQPSALRRLGPIDLWHDRAVLHFFTAKEEQDTYFELLRSLVKPDGFVIIAAFNLNGANQCSGLSVHRYDENILLKNLGSDFHLIDAFDYTYLMPSGEPRAFIYTLFKRDNECLPK